MKRPFSIPVMLLSAVVSGALFLPAHAAEPEEPFDEADGYISTPEEDEDIPIDTEIRHKECLELTFYFFVIHFYLI